MNLEEAIKTAIDYEIAIRDVYKEACEKILDVSGRRLVQALEEDEQNHVTYLQSKMEQWRKNGTITIERLNTALPPKKIIVEEVEKLNEKMSRGSMSDKKQILSKALKLEIETSDFYRKMVLVQAELDYFSKTGYWFDIKEFDME
ncbi:MAG: hypothetical protein JRI86_12710 [Deltaproteobacteria bacterium]|nr:hypothetical protein [Deltaproteobacteria bacterium]